MAHSEVGSGRLLVLSLAGRLLEKQGQEESSGDRFTPNCLCLLSWPNTGKELNLIYRDPAGRRSNGSLKVTCLASSETF